MTASNRNREEKEERALSSALLSSQEIPGRVVLAPWGNVQSQKGNFLVDEESADTVIRAFQAQGTDLPIDYEHQTLGGAYASPDGKAPAAGWIKALSFEPGAGIIGHIEWTSQGREMLASREYRYLSPVALIRKSDRRLVAIHSAALTNKPAIVAMEAIVNQAVAPIVGEPDESEGLCRLREVLALSAETNAAEVICAAHRRLRDLSDLLSDRRADELISAAMAAGKLVEAQTEWARSLIARDESLFEEWINTAPVVVTPGATRPPAGSGTTVQRSREARARAEFRSQPSLAALTTEDAFVADALRGT